MGGATESESTDITRYKYFLILTNNPMVAETLGDQFPIEFLAEASDRDVLLRARDRVHLGHRVLTAPLSGSVKPWETPYRSIMMTAEREDGVDYFSLVNMERALSIINDAKASHQVTCDAIDRDFQIIDLSLMERALPSLKATGLAQGQ
ncbi:MAG: GrdX protein [Clostridiaceae bacterium]|nr:GrdX protein [Clostridiaceae bacterium]